MDYMLYICKVECNCYCVLVVLYKYSWRNCCPTWQSGAPKKATPCKLSARSPSTSDWRRSTWKVTCFTAWKLHGVRRFVAFPATEYDEVFSGYQPGQIVEKWKNQHFKDHLCPRPQGTSLIVVGKNILSRFIPGPVSLCHWTHPPTHHVKRLGQV
jgi:hypothetical protein